MQNVAEAVASFNRIPGSTVSMCELNVSDAEGVNRAEKVLSLDQIPCSTAEKRHLHVAAVPEALRIEFPVGR